MFMALARFLPSPANLLFLTLHTHTPDQRLTPHRAPRLHQWQAETQKVLWGSATHPSTEAVKADLYDSWSADTAGEFFGSNVLKPKNIAMRTYTDGTRQSARSPTPHNLPEKNAIRKKRADACGAEQAQTNLRLRPKLCDPTRPPALSFLCKKKLPPPVQSHTESDSWPINDLWKRKCVIFSMTAK